MLTSFFGKSKPINFLIISLYLITGYVLWSFYGLDEAINFQLIIKHTLSALLCLLLLLLLDFMIRKNDLTKINKYSILLFCCFILMFPAIFSERNIILSNGFLMLALRRILSLPSEKKTNKKILDASLWITIASLFYFWSILFFLVLYIGILQKPSKIYKQLLIPFVAIIGVFTLSTVYYLLIDDSFLWFLKIDTSTGLDFSVYKSLTLLIPLLTLSTLFVVAFANKFLRFSRVSKIKKTSYVIIGTVLLVGILISMLTNQKTGAELFFIMTPLAIITANYIENIKRGWLKETILWLIVLLPISLFYFI